MRLNDLSPAPGSNHAPKRKGRGIGSGHGRTASRGSKGQHKRNTVRPGFEGGQTPLHLRLPLLRGFKNHFRVEYHIVNLHSLAAAFDGTAPVTPQRLVECGLVHDLKRPVKILGDGAVKVALEVHAHKFSKSAAEKLAEAGGSAKTIARGSRNDRRAPHAAAPEPTEAP